MAGVAVFCGGLFLAWSYWNHTGNSDETDEKDGNTEATSDYSAATEPRTHSQSSTIEGSANSLQKIKESEKDKSKNEGKRKRRSTKEELLLKNAIEFTRTQIASTESLSKQLLVSERRKKIVKFSNSPEIITFASKDCIKKKSSVPKVPNGELFKDGNLRNDEMIRKIYSGAKTEAEENSSNNLKEVVHKEEKIKSFESTVTSKISSNNIKDKFSNPKLAKEFNEELFKKGTLTKEEMFRNKCSSGQNEPRENNHKTLKENRVREEKMESAEIVISKDSDLITTSDDLFKDGKLTKENIIQTSYPGDRTDKPEDNCKNVKEEKEKDEKVKAEVKNVLSEVLAVVECKDQVKERDTRKNTEQSPTDREFVSFMYVNQGYFNSPSAGCFPMSSY